MPGEELEKTNGKQAVLLGSGINTLTARLSPQVITVDLESGRGEIVPPAPHPTPDPHVPDDIKAPMVAHLTEDKKETEIKTATLAIETNHPPHGSKTQITTIPDRTIETSTNVFTSLLSLQHAISSSLNLPIYKVVSITEQLSSNSQSSVNDIFVMLKMQCTEKTKALAGTFHLKESVESHLSNGCDFAQFRKLFGDGFVTSINYGRSALVLICFHLTNTAEQEAITSSLTAATTVTKNGSISASLQKTLESKSYSSYKFVEGMEDFSAGIFESEGDVSNFISKVFVDSKTTIEPIPIGWSHMPFSAATKTELGRKRALEFERYIEVSREHYRAIQRALLTIDVYLHQIYALETKEVPSDWYLDSKLDARAPIIDKLHAIHENFSALAAALDKHAHDPRVIEKLIPQIRFFKEELEQVPSMFPDQFDLPLARIPWDEIRPMKHHQGQYEFNLNAPTEASTIHFSVQSQAEKNYLAETKSAQALALAMDGLIKALNFAIDALQTDRNLKVAKMNMELSLAQFQLKRVEKAVAKLTESVLPESVIKLKQSIGVVKLASLSMNKVKDILDVLDIADHAVPRKDILSDAMDAIKSMGKSLHDRIRTHDDFFTAFAVEEMLEEINFHEIQVLVNGQITPQIEMLVGDNGIPAIKKKIDSIFKSDSRLVHHETGEKTGAFSLENLLMDNMVEAERAMTVAILEKVSFYHELERMSSETNPHKQQALISVGAKFYHAVVLAKSTIADGHRCLQRMLVQNGSSSHSELRQVIMRMDELQMVIDDLERNQNKVMQRVGRMVVGPDLMHLKAMFLESKRIIDNVKKTVLELPHPPHERSHIKLKQHLYKPRLFKNAKTPLEKTLIKQVEEGATIPIGDSLSHVYLKPSRHHPGWGLFSKHYPSPSEGTSVSVFASIQLSKKN